MNQKKRKLMVSNTSENSEEIEIERLTVDTAENLLLSWQLLVKQW